MKGGKDREEGEFQTSQKLINVIQNLPFSYSSHHIFHNKHISNHISLDTSQHYLN